MTFLCIFILRKNFIYYKANGFIKQIINIKFFSIVELHKIKCKILLSVSTLCILLPSLEISTGRFSYPLMHTRIFVHGQYYIIHIVLNCLFFLMRSWRALHFSIFKSISFFLTDFIVCPILWNIPLSIWSFP